jgi:hypothetical protein
VGAVTTVRAGEAVSARCCAGFPALAPAGPLTTLACRLATIIRTVTALPVTW